MSIRIDEIDRALVRELEFDGRRSNVFLARKVGLTEGAVRRRLENLIHSGAVSIVAIADPSAIGLRTHAVMCLRVDLKRIEEVTAKLAAMAELSFVYETLGPYDLIVVGFFTSEEQLRSFLTRKVGVLAGVIQSETFLIVRTVKRSQRWRETGDDRHDRAATAKTSRRGRPRSPRGVGMA